MTEKDMKAKIAELTAENAQLKSSAQRKLTLKTAKKGGVSLYGLGRFPVTLYKTQWEQVLDMAKDIRGYIQANDEHLSNGKTDPRFANVE